jgi:hypothetical protein
MRTTINPIEREVLFESTAPLGMTDRLETIVDVRPSCPGNRSQFLISDPAQRIARAAEKRREVLRFLRDEIWTVTDVVAQLLGVGYPAAHALLKVMQRDGLVTSASMFIASPRGVRRVVLHGITAQGLAFAWPADEVAEPRRPWESSKTNALFVPHQIEVQLARIRAEQAGWTNWLPARMLMGLGLPKLPDAEARSPDGVPVGVEVEREIKTDRRYEAVIGAYIAQMKADGRWDRVDYLCPNADFAKRLARVFGNLKQLRLEGKDGQATKVGEIQQSHLDRFRFYDWKVWPGGGYMVPVLGKPGKVGEA